MEAFEKWRQECESQNSEIRDKLAETGMLPSVITATEVGWRAALEWVLNIKTYGHPENLTTDVLNELEEE